MSFRTKQGRYLAQVFKSAVLRTNAPDPVRPNPSLFILPGLTARPWHDPQDACFAPWVREVEAHSEAISAEYHSLVAREDVKSDYEVTDTEHKLHNGTWDWYSYVLKGKRQSGFADACPTTAGVLDSIEDLSTGLPFDYAFFSRLKPGSDIAAHCGSANLRIRCHFAIEVPSDEPAASHRPDPRAGTCRIRVGNETKSWQEGKCIVFDDSYDHEVWNHTSRERVVLLFDTWHPEISLDERLAITDMFAEARQKGWMK
eukprot:INCI18091.1.p1 GENE.INCI18091.1~~INCI18091.1.p1  ORF type:complete len:257 (-),score=19.86 INCI18091.1:365-1135(-)